MLPEAASACADACIVCLDSASHRQRHRASPDVSIPQCMSPFISVCIGVCCVVKGMGWTCLEELVWGDKEHKWVKPGVLHTRGPGDLGPLHLPAASCLWLTHKPHPQPHHVGIAQTVSKGSTEHTSHSKAVVPVAQPGV